MRRCLREGCYYCIAYTCTNTMISDATVEKHINDKICNYMRTKPKEIDNICVIDRENNIMHDITCDQLKWNHNNKYIYYRHMLEKVYQCPYCKEKLYIHHGVSENEKLDAITKLFHDGNVSENELYGLFVAKKAKVKLSKNVLELKIGNEIWKIHFIENGVILKHNNYKTYDIGKRKPKEGFHKQFDEVVTLQYAIEYISNYKYNKYHNKNEFMKKKNRLK